MTWACTGCAPGEGCNAEVPRPPPIVPATPVQGFRRMPSVFEPDDRCWADADATGYYCCIEKGRDRLGLCAHHATQILGETT